MPTESNSTVSQRVSSEKVKQGHLTLTLPMKSTADAEAVRNKLASVLPGLFQGADKIGTVHYCRLVAMDETTFILIADFDGTLDAVLTDMSKHLGPFWDTLFEYVNQAPPAPVADNAEAFVKWAKDHDVEDFADYMAYPGVPVQQIKTLASAAGITLDAAGAQQLPLLLFMPLKGRLSLGVVKTLFSALRPLVKKGADGIGTLHFAHLMELPNHVLGMFTAYDGPFDKYAQDFATYFGPVFDLIFKFSVDPPPSPTAKNVADFTKWVKDHDAKPLFFYSAYPGLSVQDVKALLADAAAS